MDIEVLKCQAQTAKNTSKSGQAAPLDSIHVIVKKIMVLPAAFDQLAIAPANSYCYHTPSQVSFHRDYFPL